MAWVTELFTVALAPLVISKAPKILRAVGSALFSEAPAVEGQAAAALAKAAAPAVSKTAAETVGHTAADLATTTGAKASETVLSKLWQGTPASVKKNIKIYTPAVVVGEVGGNLLQTDPNADKTFGVQAMSTVGSAAGGLAGLRMFPRGLGLMAAYAGWKWGGHVGEKLGIVDGAVYDHFFPDKDAKPAPAATANGPAAPKTPAATAADAAITQTTNDLRKAVEGYEAALKASVTTGTGDEKVATALTAVNLAAKPYLQAQGKPTTGEDVNTLVTGIMESSGKKIASQLGAELKTAMDNYESAILGGNQAKLIDATYQLEMQVATMHRAQGQPVDMNKIKEEVIAFGNDIINRTEIGKFMVADGSNVTRAPAQTLPQPAAPATLQSGKS